MRITIIAVGSRGDVSPMLALGVGLRESGHQVRLAALAPFKQMAHAQALEFTSLGAMPSRFTRPRGWIPVPTFTGLSGRALFWTAYSSMLGPRLTKFYEACQGADAVIFGGLAFPAYHAAEAVGARSFWASPVPHTPTREFVDPFFSDHRFARWGGGPRRLSYHVEAQLRLQCCARQIGRWRRDTLGLAALPRSNLAAHFQRTLAGVLYGCSAHLVPRPSDWPDSVHITGDWRLPSALASSEWSAPARLQAFLSAGPKPVYVGFGSMSERNPKRWAALALRALTRAGQRGIIAGCSPELSRALQLPETVLALQEAPHDWLFPRMELIVHHGGAGTTAAAVRAGVPSVVVPFGYDQHFWAGQLRQRGVAGPSLPWRQLTAARLEKAITRGREGPQHERASTLQKSVDTEDGVGRAVAIIESMMDSNT